MGKAQAPAPVKLVFGLLASSQSLLQEACAALGERFGALETCSEAQRWEVSRYYATEMGELLWRQYASAVELIASETLAEIKQLTNSMEDRWRTVYGRRVNIDPGYLAALKLVLASTKDASHRIYLSQGIFAEVTLHFHDGSFHPYPYTYPDYSGADAIAFFNAVRGNYLKQLRDRG